MFKALETQGSIGNHLLCALSAEELTRLRLRDVAFTLGEVVYECDQRIDYAYFPTTCVVSCLYTTRDGSTAEMALAGNDGIIGIPHSSGVAQSPIGPWCRSADTPLKYPLRLCKRSSRVGVRFNASCCDTRRRSLHRSHKRLSATVCIPWNSGSADGCSCAMIE